MAQQTDKAEDHLGAWYIYNGFFDIAPRFEVFVELQLRNYEVFQNPETYFLKPYFNYNISKNWQAGFSTEFHKAFSYSSEPDLRIETSEFRFALQSINGYRVGKWRFQHRFRYEFRDRTDGNSQRYRYRFQATRPLSGDDMVKGVFFFNTNNELFLNTAPMAEFDQNRLFAACGYLFTDNINLQLGMNMVSNPEGHHFRLQVFFTHRLAFYKK